MSADIGGRSIPRALSIRQPWAELILLGKKTIELRSWTTQHRGPLLIHTGLKADLALEEGLGMFSLFHGGFVGLIDVIQVRRLDSRSWREERTMHLSPGPFPDDVFGWYLARPRRFATPIRGRGEMGLFEPAQEYRQDLAIALSALFADGI